MSEKCRLRIMSERQLVGRSVEAKRAQRKSQRFIHLGECVASFRKSVREILPHSRFLRALSGEKQHDVHALEADDHRGPREARAKRYQKHGAALANSTLLYCFVDRYRDRSR